MNKILVTFIRPDPERLEVFTFVFRVTAPEYVNLNNVKEWIKSAPFPITVTQLRGKE